MSYNFYVFVRTEIVRPPSLRKHLCELLLACYVEEKEPVVRCSRFQRRNQRRCLKYYFHQVSCEVELTENTKIRRNVKAFKFCLKNHSSILGTKIDNLLFVLFSITLCCLRMQTWILKIIYNVKNRMDIYCNHIKIK